MLEREESSHQFIDSNTEAESIFSDVAGGMQGVQLRQATNFRGATS